jgi:hypothetical protein
MTKYWLIPFFMAGLLGDKAFADCLPAEDTPASVIEYFQKFNKPLPEKFCAKESPPQASHEPPQDSSQTEEGPDRYDDHDGPDDGPFSQYQGDLGRGYEIDQGGRYERDQDGGYERGEGYERDQEGVMSGTKGAVTSVTKKAVMSGTKGAAMRGTMRPVTRETGTLTATTIGKMTTRIKAATIGKAMANRGNAMASANPSVKRPT